MTGQDQAPKSGNLKRVAGNTLFMYSRTVISLVLNFFSSRRQTTRETIKTRILAPLTKTSLHYSSDFSRGPRIIA